ncbi:SBF-like CPA transporter family-domain-containing protein [Scenedesmus sp. NREL 46B-D3]|nr:SBF-like CPA transporter family-domain-containing protein [Scenedesmus sp. NREL 46B-D3]
MRKQEDPDAPIGVTVADDVRPQHSSEVKQADVSSWSCRSTCSKVYHYMLAQWFIVGLGVAIAFAAAVPKLGATKGYIRAEYSIKIPAIIVIFIISGLGLKTKALLTAAADLRIHLLVQGLSLAAIPAIGYGVALALRNGGFNDYLADGLVIMACMPTTVSTNVVYTARAAGNEAAALVNAVLGNIIGIFITPLWLGLYLNVEGVAPYADVLVELSYTIIAPLIVGQLMQYITPGVVAWIKKHINTANVSSFCILLLVWATFCNTFSNGSTKQVPGGDVAATVFLGVALFFLFLAVSFVVAWPPPPVTALRRVLRLSRADVVAVVICGSTKTVALGVPLINVMYKQVPYAGLLAMPLIIYHALQVLLGGLMLETLRKWCLGGKEDSLPSSGTAGSSGLSHQHPHAASGSSRRWSLAQLLLPGSRSSSQRSEGQPVAAAAAAGGGSDGQQSPR